MRRSIWLDRLFALNQSFPPAEDAILGQLTLVVNADSKKGGQMELKGEVRRQEDIKGMEEKIAAHGYSMDVKKCSGDEHSTPPYALSFEASVLAHSSSASGPPAWRSCAGFVANLQGPETVKLQRREKILAGSALGLLVLVGLWFLFFAGDSRSAEQLIAEESKLTNEIESKQKQVQAAGRDAKRFAEWQRRALPPDPVLARSLYQNWIGGLAAKVNFHAYTLQATEVAHATTKARGFRLPSAAGRNWATWWSSCTNSTRRASSTRSASWTPSRSRIPATWT